MADYTTAELAEKAGTSQAYLRQEIKDGRLRAVKRGNLWLIAEAEASRWLANPRRGDRAKRKK